jgi:hypothetical protein
MKMTHTVRTRFFAFAGLILLAVFSPAAAIDTLQVTTSDPVLEPWRCRSFPELRGLGLRSLAEDRDGAMWFGVDEGMRRYEAGEYFRGISSGEGVGSTAEGHGIGAADYEGVCGAVGRVDPCGERGGEGEQVYGAGAGGVQGELRQAGNCRMQIDIADFKLAGCPSSGGGRWAIWNFQVEVF